MIKFKFRVGIKIKEFAKMLALLIFLSSLTLLLFMTKPKLFNMNFVAYTLAFDFLYVFTLFPLKGGSLKKLVALLIGNVLSFIWNGLYPSFLLLFFQRNSISNKIFQFINPVVNALWIISIWAFGLSLVTIQNKRRTRTL